MGNRGTYPQTAGRSDTLQGSTSFLHDVCQTSVARNLAGRGKNSGTTRPERVFLKKLPLLRGGRPNRRFREFHVHGRHFTSPQESGSKRGRSSVQGHMARRTDVENRIRNGQITNRGIIWQRFPYPPGHQPGKRKTRRAAWRIYPRWIHRKKGARVHFLLQRNRHQVLRLPIFPRENKFMIKHEQKPGPWNSCSRFSILDYYILLCNEFFFAEISDESST